MAPLTTVAMKRGMISARRVRQVMQRIDFEHNEMLFRGPQRRSRSPRHPRRRGGQRRSRSRRSSARDDDDDDEEEESDEE